MKAAYFVGDRKFDVRDVARPNPAAGEVRVRVRRCGICGSDLHFFHGGGPLPFCPGHEMSGEIAATGAGADRREGDRVVVEPLVVCGSCWACRSGNRQLCPAIQFLGITRDGGFSEEVVCPEYALFPLPEAIDHTLGALAEPLAVTVHGVRLADFEPGATVLVQGAGTIGLCSIAAARAAGAGEVWITARHPQQIEAAKKMGATRVFSGAGADGELAELARQERIDTVVETVGGAAETLGQAVQLVRRGGSVVVLGIFTEARPLDAVSLVVKEVRLIGSMVYDRHSRLADFDVALALLSDAPETFRGLVTGTFPLERIHDAFEAASDKRSGAIKVSIEP